MLSPAWAPNGIAHVALFTSFGCHSDMNRVIEWWLDKHDVYFCCLHSGKTTQKRGSMRQGGEKEVTPEKPDSSGNTSVPSCHWSKMGQLRDPEMSGWSSVFLVQEEENGLRHHAGTP